MGRKYTRKLEKAPIDPHHVAEAVQRVIKGEKVRPIASEFNIPRSSLSRYVLKYKTNGGDLNNLLPSFQNSMVFTPQQEEALATYLTKCSSLITGVTRDCARSVAYEMAATNKIKIPKSWHINQKAGADWLRGFLERHPDVCLHEIELNSSKRKEKFSDDMLLKHGHPSCCVKVKDEAFSDISSCCETSISTVNISNSTSTSSLMNSSQEMDDKTNMINQNPNPEISHKFTSSPLCLEMLANTPKRHKPRIKSDQVSGAVQRVLNGEKLRTVASEFDISKSSLSRYVIKYKTNGGDFCNLLPNYENLMTFKPQQEAALASYLTNCSPSSYGLTRDSARLFAYEMAVENNIKVPKSWQKNKIAGPEWLGGFLKQHPNLLLRQMGTKPSTRKEECLEDTLCRAGLKNQALSDKNSISSSSLHASDSAVVASNIKSESDLVSSSQEMDDRISEMYKNSIPEITHESTGSSRLQILANIASSSFSPSITDKCDKNANILLSGSNFANFTKELNNGNPTSIPNDEGNLLPKKIDHSATSPAFPNGRDDDKPCSSLTLHSARAALISAFRTSLVDIKTSPLDVKTRPVHVNKGTPKVAFGRVVKSSRGTKKAHRHRSRTSGSLPQYIARMKLKIQQEKKSKKQGLGNVLNGKKGLFQRATSSISLGMDIS